MQFIYLFPVTRGQLKFRVRKLSRPAKPAFNVGQINIFLRAEVNFGENPRARFTGLNNFRNLIHVIETFSAFELTEFFWKTVACRTPRH